MLSKILNWLPWRWLLSNQAKKSGVLDPFKLISTLEGFSQPSEIKVPFELLRAGMVFHARGLVNSRVIQQNLDWIWPFWIQRQFNPLDRSFIPRAFSLTHVNLTNRNWSAIGLPGFREYPIVDPRGLLTPFYDGWSVDVWIKNSSGTYLFPSKINNAEQKQIYKDGLKIETITIKDEMRLEIISSVELEENKPVCIVKVQVSAEKNGEIFVSIRPFNPEGISFINTISYEKEHKEIFVNDTGSLKFNRSPKKVLFSNYNSGDVFDKLSRNEDKTEVECAVGLASAAVSFDIRNPVDSVEFRIPLKEIHTEKNGNISNLSDWKTALRDTTKFNYSKNKFSELFDASLRTILLLSPDKDTYPGPYTYKRFWFRDSIFIIQALLCTGLKKRAEKIINGFAERQRNDGFFLSQEGEWDSNGQVLWIIDNFLKFTDQKASKEHSEMVEKGAEWIINKRMKDQEIPLRGLMPAGFSAEHLGNNDYYYWDDFWSCAGLFAAGKLMNSIGKKKLSEKYFKSGRDLFSCIGASLEHYFKNNDGFAMPASPLRRRDSGAIGSIVAGYPLRLFGSKDFRLTETVEFLMKKCFVNGGLFQDMIHSGINPYLTLHVAQILLRSGDQRYLDLVKVVAELASDTGQWPEAVHPVTGGGCMGDGAHAWASAEWIMMMRNMMLYEEPETHSLIVGRGVISSMFPEDGDEISINNAPTLYGTASVKAKREGRKIKITVNSDFKESSTRIIFSPCCKNLKSMVIENSSVTVNMEEIE